MRAASRTGRTPAASLWCGVHRDLGDGDAQETGQDEQSGVEGEPVDTRVG
jgi:hypothetical protein